MHRITMTLATSACLLALPLAAQEIGADIRGNRAVDLAPACSKLGWLHDGKRFELFVQAVCHPAPHAAGDDVMR